MATPQTGRVIKVIGKFCVSAGLVAWLFSSGRIDLKPIGDSVRNPLHLLGIGLILASQFVQVIRWRGLLRLQKIRVPLMEAVTITWNAQFLALLFPGGAAGGDLVRGYYVFRRTPHGRLAALSTLVMDRIAGLAALTGMGLAALAAAYLLQQVPANVLIRLLAATAAAAAGIAAYFVSIYSRRFQTLFLRCLPGRFRDGVHEAMETYAAGRYLARAMVLSVAASFLAISPFVVAGGIVKMPISWLQALMAVPLIFVAAILPVSPGGFGVAESAAAVLFSMFGCPGGATIMLTVRMWMLISKLPGAVLVVASGSCFPPGRQDGKARRAP